MISKRTRIAAYGLVKSNDRMLLCRISKELPKWSGHWTLPGGGIDFGEHPESAMIREVMEETGIKVTANSVATVDSRYTESETEHYHAVRVIYHAQYMSGTIRNEINGSTDKCAWFSRSEIDELPLVDITSMGVNLLF